MTGAHPARTGEEVLECDGRSSARDLGMAALEKTDGVIEGSNGAATILDLHPNTLRSRMKKLGIDRAGSHEMS
jgi:transcriptional regulator with GAF, ATPase, and Fis domain